MPKLQGPKFHMGIQALKMTPGHAPLPEPARQVIGQLMLRYHGNKKMVARHLRDHHGLSITIV